MTDDDSDPLKSAFSKQVTDSIETKSRLLDELDGCVDVANLLIETYRNGNQLLVFGNGGSAADAQHIAAEFLGRFYIERGPMPAQALTVNTSALTAIANDYSFEDVFSRQLEAFAKPGDVAIGISTSGNATNVVKGLKKARELGLATVAMTGKSGGAARNEADHWIGVPSDDTPRIQECHILIGHIWSALVEAALFS